MAASWWPDQHVLEIYRKEGVKIIINCSEFDNRAEIPKDFEYYHINIPDYGTPTRIQLEKFIEITNENGAIQKPVVVHCVAGCGRTGIMIVAWAAHEGYIPKEMDPVQWIRKLRRCSLETREQEDFARNVAKRYQKQF